MRTAPRLHTRDLLLAPARDHVVVERGVVRIGELFSGAATPARPGAVVLLMVLLVADGDVGEAGARVVRGAVRPLLAGVIAGAWVRGANDGPGTEGAGFSGGFSTRVLGRGGGLRGRGGSGGDRGVLRGRGLGCGRGSRVGLARGRRSVGVVVCVVDLALDGCGVRVAAGGVRYMCGRKDTVLGDFGRGGVGADDGGTEEEENERGAVHSVVCAVGGEEERLIVGVEDKRRLRWLTQICERYRWLTGSVGHLFG
ncbi:hypothetical protein B0H15DRAFT_831644 [Mycena belliarum]|uniref:Uncharacterized protein n=1 Tax=Mycena belliarum TaxID=1033014 RepID=A0AAD6UD60_9AGAR|nr:hypothetical protein B0H15DRAFT_831644 [Mycena belliae]